MCIFRRKFKTREMYSHLAKRDYVKKKSSLNEDYINNNDQNDNNQSDINDIKNK
jgi:hypothetical protein